jgi:hypothetical protein
MSARSAARATCEVSGTCLTLTLTDMLQSFDDSNVFNWAAAGTNVVAISGGTSQTYVAYNHNTSAQQLLIDQAILVLAVL